MNYNFFKFIHLIVYYKISFKSLCSEQSSLFYNTFFLQNMTKYKTGRKFDKIPYLSFVSGI